VRFPRIDLPPRGPGDLTDIDAPPESTARALSQESGSSEGNEQVTMSHGPAFVSPPSLSGRNHSARDLALSPLHAERDVEESLAERGFDVSYETVRRWVLKFGPLIARKLR
jgi:hypothetical protein